MRCLLTLLLVLLPALGMALTPAEAVARFAASAGISPSQTAVLITDLETGRDIVAYNEERPLIPASIMKSVTAASLLDKGGYDHRYLTEVYVDGNVDGDVLNGNVIVVGSGDPTIASDREPASADFIGEIVEALRRLDVDTVNGRVIIDNGYFTGPAVPESWAAGDRKSYYGTGVHAFNYARNASGKSSVANPAAVFQSALKSRFTLAGIRLREQELPQGERSLLLTHTSAPYEDIMRSCMMRSDNMYAECMLRTFGRLSGGNGDTEGSAAIETEFWKKRRAPMDGVVIIDGSGLSRDNRVTARFMDHVLHAMRESVEYASFFPLAGQEGTLKNYLADTPLEAYVAMKTGSMNGIQCYAGYLLDDDFAPTHSIVFIMNGLTNRGQARAASERLLLDLFAPTDSEQ